ncbi:hypothetical protein [Calidifontibacter indicus]|uniref:hypothetical protein n=1 Tax=Calidifontibacter indicus TaxID=419650 RepID=UPI003D71CC89
MTHVNALAHALATACSGCADPLRNVLAAIDALMTSTDDASTVLDERRPEIVTEAVCAIDEPRAHAVRELFGGYGCCDVAEPIAELRTLGLIDPTPEEHQ